MSMGSGGDDESRYADGSSRLFDVLLLEEDPAVILGELARIVGETLRVDRSLIFDISFSDDRALGLIEWLTPERAELATARETYPLGLFRRCAELLFSTRTWFESHAEAPHPALVADGAVSLLHGDLRIRSLLWYPFSFRADGFYTMVFNYIDDGGRAAHVWQPRQLEFMRTATRHVGMALMKIELLRQRAAAEAALFKAQKRESLGILAGGVAHDLNSLMVGVVSSAELLARRIPDESPLRETIRTIADAGMRASRLAGQLLAYAGKTTPGTAVISFAEIATETLQLVRATIDADVELVIEPSAPAVDGNASQLEQVVMNLLVNAAEASPGSAPIELRLGARDLTPTEAAELGVAPGRFACLTVTDHGSGMDAAVLARVFDPFFSTKFAGRGLGLSAVQGIVKHHRGAIRISSTAGSGSTVTVLIPAAVRASQPKLAHRVVLVVDDEPTVLAGVTALLEDVGFRCHAASGGRAALELFAAHEREICGALLDLTMPEPSGTEVLAALRRMRPDLPVVVMSGYARDAGALPLDGRTRFVAKPFSTTALVAALEAVIGTVDSATTLSETAAVEQVERGR
jgi:signal transduction histidine kinase/CheY-like chemotaxis protein